MTAADLLAAKNPKFIAACNYWQEHGRAPLPYADELLEMGMEGQFAAWEWAAQTERSRGDGKFSGPSPWQAGSDHKWVWFMYEDRPPFYNDLPKGMFKGWYRQASDDFPTAVAWFLDRWAEVYAANRTPAAASAVGS